MRVISLLLVPIRLMWILKIKCQERYDIKSLQIIYEQIEVLKLAHKFLGDGNVTVATLRMMSIFVKV